MGPDDALVSRLVARDPEAWKELLERHGGMIEGTCRRVLGPLGRASEAPDVAADILRNLLDRDCRLLRAFRAGTSLGAYLRVLARSRALNATRSHGPQAGREPLRESLVEAPVERVLETEERGRVLRDAVSRLPPDEAMALRLFHLEGLGYAVLGERMGIPRDQVAMVLRRARERLRETLGPDFQDSL